MKIQWLPEGTKLRPLRDQIVVKALEWRPSALIEIAGNQRRPMRGEVVAVGPARRVKAYGRDSKGQRCKVYDYGQTIPTEVRPGDIVELGGLELDGYHFQQVTIGSEVHVICQEQDVVFYRRPAPGIPNDAERAAGVTPYRTLDEQGNPLRVGDIRRYGAL